LAPFEAEWAPKYGPAQTVTIIPALSGKLIHDGKVSAVSFFPNKWPGRHPEVRAGSRMSLAVQMQAVLAHA
jgi:hypothetical protein